MSNLIILTGVNRGLGLEIYNILNQQPELEILSIGRKFNPTQIQASEQNPLRLISYADLSNEQDLKKLHDVLKSLTKEYQQITFISNSSTVNPIGQIGQLEETQIRTSLQLNTLAPISICNSIIQNMHFHQLKVINISSGAAHTPIEGWGMYCATKAANEMFFKVLAEENPKVSILNFQPGVMNTDMQAQIRASDEKQMPKVEMFQNLYQTQALKDPKEVAEEVCNNI